jgi:LmbE family N-acetylglucosaminyl deacetylase
MGNERVLIIAPHADDEVLGCGGLIEKACRHNNSIRVILGAVGDTHFWHANKKITASTRLQEFKDAINHLGCNDFIVLYKDKEALLDTVPKQELVTKIDNQIKNFEPTMVFIPYPSFHQDHQILFEACMAGLRPKPNKNYKLIAMFEYPYIVWQYPKITEAGELYLDISQTIDKKIEALQKHKSQLREDEDLISHKNVKRWAELRGLECGVPYAEKYYILRSTIM